MSETVIGAHHGACISAIIREDATLVAEELGPLMAPLSGKTLLVTGAAGFLCSHLLDVLAAFNERFPPCRVIALDNFSIGVPSRIAHLENDPHITIVTHDVTKPFPQAWAADYIVHGASIASPTFYRRYPLETIAVNVDGLRNALDLGHKFGCIRAVFLSTSEVYGDPTPEYLPTPESYRGRVSCTGPRACYDESKRLGESISMIYRRLYDLPVRILRPFNIYGPGQRLDDLRIIPDLMSAALRHNPIVLLSDGKATRSFCYVRDALRAMLFAMLSDAPHDIFNIGNDEGEVSIRTVAERVAAIAGPPPLSVEHAVSDDADYVVDNPRRRCPDLTRLRALGFAPQVPLREGTHAHPRRLSLIGEGNSMKVAVVGCGYVGITNGCGLSELGHEVVCVDIDEQRVAQLRRGQLPFTDPLLREQLNRGLDRGSLRVTNRLAEAMCNAEVSILAVDTPSQAHGAIDLTQLRTAAHQLGQLLPQEPGHVVIVKSTVVPGTCDTVVREALARGAGRDAAAFGLAMVPEFLREGSAAADFAHPDRVVIGADEPHAGDVAEALYRGLNGQVIRTSLRNAELIKYGANALLATMISFSNELASLCEHFEGVDIEQVFEGIHHDRRLSPFLGERRIQPEILSYLRAGAGFGGHCLPKDLKALRAFASDIDVSTPLLDAVLTINERRPGEVVALLEDNVGPIRDRRVALLGVAFKPGTSDTRCSPAIELAKRLTQRGAQVRAWDPTQAAGEQPWGQLFATLDEALAGAHGAVIATGWPQLMEVDWAAAAARMATPVLLDGRNLLIAAGVKVPAAMRYCPIGRVHRHPKS